MGFVQCSSTRMARRVKTVLQYCLYVVAAIVLLAYLGIEVKFNINNAKAISGIALYIVLCFVFSFKPSKVNWHTVFWGFVIQFAFATLTLRTTFGYEAFKWVGDLVNDFVRISDKGSAFVFGAIFKSEPAGLFLDSCGIIVFFNACIFLLEYLGVLEYIVLTLGRGLALLLQTGPVESVVAAANIFIGLSEAPLLVRPYLPTVTCSELHAIMTCGFASISGSFMAMFIRAGAPATHLLTAAVISAPAALAISKLVYPEVARVDLASQRHITMKDQSVQRTALKAFSEGAIFSIKLVGAIMVNMIAFVSLLHLVDKILVFLGGCAGIEGLTFEYVCSYVLYPLAFIMGVDFIDCKKVAAIMGIKMLATPFVAYVDLGRLIQNRQLLETYKATTNGTWHWSGNDIILDATNTTLVGGFLTPRSEIITTYALCGLSATPAIGFTMGTLIPMSPQRKEDVVRLVLSAFIAGNLANCVTGSVAGVMIAD